MLPSMVRGVQRLGGRARVQGTEIEPDERSSIELEAADEPTVPGRGPRRPTAESARIARTASENDPAIQALALRTQSQIDGRVIHSNAKVIRGTEGDDIIYGGGANQTILGGGGNDIIIGGGGGDRISGGKGDDRLYGVEGGDQLRGGIGNDRITGGRGNDRLSGDGGNDRMAGEIGDDHLFGGRGHDSATGGMGIDVLRGGRGNDVQSGDAGPDFVDGGRGNDTVSYASHSGPGYNPNKPESGILVDDDRRSPFKSRYEGVYYPGTSLGGSRAGGGSGVDGLRSNENVVGSSKDDRIIGDFDTVDGGPGRDRTQGNIRNKISASGEPDAPVSTEGAVVQVSRSGLTGHTTINVSAGGSDDDIVVRRNGNLITVTDPAGVELRGRGGADANTVRFRVSGPIDALQIEGGSGADRLRASGFRNVPVTLTGGRGDDRLIGGKGNDVLNDGAGNDTLIGGGGSDGLTNSSGRDRLHGGGGADLLVSSSIDRGDLLNGGKGQDNISFAQVGDEFGVRAEIGGTARRIGRGGKPTGPAATITGSADDLEGTERADTLIGDQKVNHILGRGGPDTLVGLAGDDLLEAEDGERDRRLDGGAGRDKATHDGHDRRALKNVEIKR
jgi:Ca2+-binding RTX toxin-like protein